MSADSFQKLTQIEHVRKRPDTYIGSIATTEETRWCLQDQKMIQKKLKYNPGLEQCILELLTNAVDHSERCIKKSLEPVTKIDINLTSDSFTVKNNGQGIPIEKKDGMYIPEMIFGHLLTSSNYNDSEQRNWNGTNGLGCKVCNIFSKSFTVEVVSSGQKYEQTFSDNLSKKTEPKIKACKLNDYTKITFCPDFSSFKMKSFDDHDNKLVIEKRIYDITAMISKKITVSYNDTKLQLKSFGDYVELYTDSKKIPYEDANWSLYFAMNPYDVPTQVSFVNGVATEEGGTHVNHVMDQVVKKVVEHIEKMAKVKKAGIVIKPAYVREKIIVFVKASIVNPRFGSQTKTQLKSSPTEFGSRCVVPDDIISKICKLGLVEEIIQTAEAKQLALMKKETSATKKSRISDVPKLDDANFAGTKQSNLCTLILTEGDSAKSMVLSGLSAIPNAKNIFGVFPLKGKLLNVKTATVKQLSENEELININKILGLSHDLKNKSNLRYHSCMIMTDSDHDGSHIKGLLMNYFTEYWPEIVSSEFITTLLTPVVKVTVGKKVLSFYNNSDHEKWALENKNIKFSQKYYKGLGTSTSAEAKEYFKDLSKNKVFYEFNSERDIPKIKLAFDKTLADDRKEWISNAIVKNKTPIDYTKKKVSVSSFIDNELVLFSIYDCSRSLPNMMDGLKVSQRKVLFGTMKYGPTEKNQVKVAELGSYISGLTHYHHGEVSLQGTIVNMAQEFVSSGNAQVLFPSGQFGTRNEGGADAASSRYIFTYLKDWVRVMYNEYDSAILEYNTDDSVQIEPKMFVPVLPMILLNGATGIGTGWSCDVPCFNPKDIISNIKLMNLGKAPKEMIPWYKGFKGTITTTSVKNRWISRGQFSRLTKKRIHITELPIGLWYENFKDLLKKYELINFLTFEDNLVTENGLDYDEFTVTFTDDITDEQVVKLLKLESNISATNMVGFSSKLAIKKYSDPLEILKEFYEYRLNFYGLRKKYMCSVLEKKLNLVSEKLRFIKLVISDKIVVFKRSKKDVTESMNAHKFSEEHIDLFLEISIVSFTEELIKKLESEVASITEELNVLKAKSEKVLWTEDLDKLNF
jgi:DNA topoisomerase II